MKKTIILLIYILMASALAWADETDQSQASLRIDPVIDDSGVEVYSEKTYPSYINVAANVIEMNGEDWSDLSRRFAQAADTVVSVLHIGDSHLQADMATAVTRTRLQKFYGSHGRGLIIPFKLAGTNEPHDYAITSTTGVVSSRLLKMPWPTEMTFSGIGIEPIGRKLNLTVRPGQDFDHLVIHSSGPGVEITSLTDNSGVETEFEVKNGRKTLEIDLPRPFSSLGLQLNVPAGVSIGGIQADRGNSGISYHVIGNNGATYSTYSLIPSMGADVSVLNPDLIILSLGTNEAFGKISDATFKTDIDILVRDLRRHNPDSRILLVTPAECQRKTTRRVRRKGRRRSVTSYSVNNNVKRLRNVILAYARENHLPVYDWYAVAGGDGSSAKWLGDKTLNKDRVHLTAKGYNLQGNLFTDALLKTLQK